MTDPKAKDKRFVDKLGEKAINEAAEKFLEPILNSIGKFCSEFGGYLADFDQHVKDLELAGLELTATGNCLRNKVEIALLHSSNMKTSTKVVQWYEKEELKEADVSRLLQRGKREDGRLCLGKWCVGRWRYGKDVVECCKRLKGVKEEGEKLIRAKEFLEQGAPDGEELLSGFENEFRELRDAIICIEKLKKAVMRKLEASTIEYGVHAIEAWLDLVDLELQDGKLLTSRKEKHLGEFRNRGSGPPPPIQGKVKSCIKRILKLQGEGENHLKDLIAGASSSSKEAPPQPQPQPQPYMKNQKSIFRVPSGR